PAQTAPGGGREEGEGGGVARDDRVVDRARAGGEGSDRAPELVPLLRDGAGRRAAGEAGAVPVLGVDDPGGDARRAGAGGAGGGGGGDGARREEPPRGGGAARRG